MDASLRFKTADTGYAAYGHFQAIANPEPLDYANLLRACVRDRKKFAQAKKLLVNECPVLTKDCHMALIETAGDVQEAESLVEEALSSPHFNVVNTDMHLPIIKRICKEESASKALAYLLELKSSPIFGHLATSEACLTAILNASCQSNELQTGVQVLQNYTTHLTTSALNAMARFYALANGVEGLRLLFNQVPVSRFSRHGLESAVVTVIANDVSQGPALFGLLRDQGHSLSTDSAKRILTGVRNKLDAIQVEQFIQGVAEFLPDADVLPLAFEAAVHKTVAAKDANHLVPMLQNWATKVSLADYSRSMMRWLAATRELTYTSAVEVVDKLVELGAGEKVPLLLALGQSYEQQRRGADQVRVLDTLASLDSLPRKIALPSLTIIPGQAESVEVAWMALRIQQQNPDIVTMGPGTAPSHYVCNGIFRDAQIACKQDKAVVPYIISKANEMGFELDGNAKLRFSESAVRQGNNTSVKQLLGNAEDAAALLRLSYSAANSGQAKLAFSLANTARKQGVAIDSSTQTELHQRYNVPREADLLSDHALLESIMDHLAHQSKQDREKKLTTIARDLGDIELTLNDDQVLSLLHKYPLNARLFFHYLKDISCAEQLRDVAYYRFLSLFLGSKNTFTEEEAEQINGLLAKRAPNGVDRLQANILRFYAITGDVDKAMALVDDFKKDGSSSILNDVALRLLKSDTPTGKQVAERIGQQIEGDASTSSENALQMKMAVHNKDDNAIIKWGHALLQDPNSFVAPMLQAAYVEALLKRNDLDQVLMLIQRCADKGRHSDVDRLAELIAPNKAVPLEALKQVYDTIVNYGMSVPIPFAGSFLNRLLEQDVAVATDLFHQLQASARQRHKGALTTVFVNVASQAGRFDVALKELSELERVSYSSFQRLFRTAAQAGDIGAFEEGLFILKERKRELQMQQGSLGALHASRARCYLKAGQLVASMDELLAAAAKDVEIDSNFILAMLRSISHSRHATDTFVTLLQAQGYTDALADATVRYEESLKKEAAAAEAKSEGSVDGENEIARGDSQN
eukprot:TRINITY_DN11995_c0_g1_i3.p1 TRINITY_DN11995_c0_g1~~TRINITY_DN11995_c0_g1_i3.p1  ORF type:complete len:1137 (+),score=362.15 TRINITY_DN11995_c0_g1_i3:301-3411(+)